ncbi:MAG: DUF4397 domain-containing protein [Ktedonobacteraceae bacterium]|nr:DUF4397 domain-containing protein [Ktedonobacteraceae bacterium]
MKRKSSLVLVLHCISIILTAFILVVFPGVATPSASAETPAFVRVMHASPDVGTADVFLDGAKALSNFQFGTVTHYLTIPPGPHKVQVALIGKDPSASMISQVLSVQPGVAYTVAALGRESTGFKLEAFVDNNRLATGKAKVRLYHLSPGTGAVDVSLNGNTLINGISYQQASNYVTLHEGSYTFNVSIAQPRAVQSYAVSLKANTVTTIFVVGVFNGTPQFQFISSQEPGIPGLPSTGSDPNASPAPPAQGTLPLNPWLPAVLALFLLGAGVVARQKARMRAHK